MTVHPDSHICNLPSHQYVSLLLRTGAGFPPEGEMLSLFLRVPLYKVLLNEVTWKEWQMAKRQL